MYPAAMCQSALNPIRGGSTQSGHVRLPTPQRGTCTALDRLYMPFDKPLIIIMGDAFHIGEHWVQFMAPKDAYVEYDYVECRA